MKKLDLLSFIVSAAALAIPAAAQTPGAPVVTTVPGGRIYTPWTSIERPADRGKRAHTNVELFFPTDALTPGANTPGGYFETPASLACVYKQVKGAASCNPTIATAVSTAGSRAIAIVDAYDDPNAASDLAAYSAEFGLPAPTAKNFEVIYAAAGSSMQTTTPPPQDSSGGWESEEALDIEMAHAMAPRAKIYLVEAASSGSGDLFPAVTLASNLVTAAGGGEVSMSWGFGDFNGESGFDGYFQTAGVVYFSSAGDSAGLNYPSTSPFVVSAGGSTISRNPATGDFIAEAAWPNTGGGATPNEPRPSYQNAISTLVGANRGTPDLAFVADGRTGVWGYDTFPINGNAGNWYIFSGTSVASPALAGLVNAAGTFAASSNAELTTLYGNLGNAKDFRDITNGNCGPYAGYLALKGWDFCTGVGTVQGKNGL
jgi:subtilase family serine protease